ncbi:MAG: DUF2799 domain-containing protein [Gammaproteobacteria bacterium]
MDCRSIIAFSAMLLLGGCASMSADECRTADWRTVGFEDGQNGSPGRLGDYRKDCAKAGIAPDLDEYELGRAEGVRRYCTPAKGYDVGKSGGSHYGVCPSDLEVAFSEAFKDGRILYRLTAEVNQIESRISDVYRDIDYDEEEIRELERQLVEEPGDRANRQRLLDEIKERTRSAEAHRIELVELDRDLFVAERDLEEYRELQGDGYR